MNDQRSTLDQLNDLYKLAVEHGMYDAADWMKARLAETFDAGKPVRQWEEDLLADLGFGGAL